MKADRLLNEFSTRRVSPPDAPLRLDADDALELVDHATEEGVPIVAIAVFREPDVGARARPDDAADFSSGVAEGHGCWDVAEAFIQERRHLGVAFQLALGVDPIEAV